MNIKLRKPSSYRLLISMLLLGAAVILGLIAPARAASDTQKLQKFVNHDRIEEHLEALQKIANNNVVDGNHVKNREVGTPGDVATRNYIATQLAKAGLKVTRQEYTFDFFKEGTPSILQRVSPTPFTYSEGQPSSSSDFHITTNSGNGNVTATIQPVDVVIPPGATPNTSNSGCEPEDFASFTAGNIALLQRGSCSFSQKVINAVAAGAVGVVLFNEGTPVENSGGVDRIGLIGTIIASTPVTPIPVVFARFSVGEELYKLSLAGNVTVHLATNAEHIPTTTENIFGETLTGNPAQIVMAGAHLDSVNEGPGINDNGSGVGTLLAIAKGMKSLNISPINKVRFAFWSAEEEGQVGSDHYVSELTPDEAAKIALYLNLDMMGSPNFVPTVYDGDGSTLPPVFGPVGGPESAEIEKVFVEYFKIVNPHHAQATLIAIDQRSDYKAFLNNNIPFGAITSGFDANKTAEEAKNFGGTAGQPYDSCYHKACDTTPNVSERSLDLMSGAAVYTIMDFATRTVIFP